jgi:hypothetical protein
MDNTCIKCWPRVDRSRKILRCCFSASTTSRRLVTSECHPNGCFRGRWNATILLLVASCHRNTQDGSDEFCLAVNFSRSTLQMERYSEEARSHGCMHLRSVRYQGQSSLICFMQCHHLILLCSSNCMCSLNSIMVLRPVRKRTGLLSLNPSSHS